MNQPNKAKRNQVLLDLVDNILTKCKQENIEIRVLGGLAIFMKCPAHGDLFETLREPISDIDLLMRMQDIERIERLFSGMDFQQDRNFKMLFGYQRRIFYTPSDVTIEIYLDNLYLCREIKISGRLSIDYPTISLTDLLLSKIQEINLSNKSIFDILILLANYGFAGSEQKRVDLEYIARLCSKEWGWWKIIKNNIHRLHEKANEFPIDREIIKSRLKRIEIEIDSVKKTLAWKIRDLIGEKMRWYEIVDNSADCT